MSKIEKLIEVAEGYIGTKENPAGSNNVIFNTEFYKRAVKGGQYSWCCVFVAYCFMKAGIESLWLNGKWRETAYCPYVAQWAKNNKRWSIDGKYPNAKYRVGDVVLFDFNNDKQPEHIGIIVSVNADGSYGTVEGNTSASSNDNGGAVMKRQRNNSQILGVYRPDYEAV